MYIIKKSISRIGTRIWRDIALKGIMRDYPKVPLHSDITLLVTQLKTAEGCLGLVAVPPAVTNLRVLESVSL